MQIYNIHWRSMEKKCFFDPLFLQNWYLEERISYMRSFWHCLIEIFREKGIYFAYLGKIDSLFISFMVGVWKTGIFLCHLSKMFVL